MSSLNDSSTEDDRISELYHQLSHFYLVGDYQRALQAGMELLSRDPDNAFLHYRVGECLRMLGQRKQAIVHLKKSLSLAPDYADALNALGLCFLGDGKAGLAYDHINRAVSLDPEDSFNWYSKGLCHLAFEQGKKVLVCAEKIRQLDPESAWSTDLEVRASFDLTKATTFNRDERLRIILAALEREPEDASFHARLSELKLRDFRALDEAETHARVALRLEPGDSDYRKALIAVLREKDPVLRVLRAPLCSMRFLKRGRSLGKKKRFLIFGLPILLLGLLFFVGVSLFFYDLDDEGAMLCGLSFSLLLLPILVHMIFVLFYALFCWPIAKAYEYLTIADVYKKAGDLSFYSRPMARFHQSSFALRMAVFSLIPLAFWTALASLVLFPELGAGVLIITLFVFRLAGGFFILCILWSVFKRTFLKFKVR